MAHLNYYLDLCVDTYVVNDGAVLLRLHEKYNHWGSPGGHVDLGEDINEAALREVWEEVGLKVELVRPEGWVKKDSGHNLDLVPPLFVNRHRINEVHEHSSFIFVGKSDSRVIAPQTVEDKGAECRWVTQEELDELFKNDNRLALDEYRYASSALGLVKFCENVEIEMI